MHQDVAGGNARMAAGQWETGISKQARAAWGVTDASTGIGSRAAARAAAPRVAAADAVPGKLAADTGAAADVLRKTIDEKSRKSVKVEGSGKVDIKIAEAPKPKGETEKHFFKPNPVEHKAQMEPARTGPETHPEGAPR
jgi:hypothetical protein